VECLVTSGYNSKPYEGHKIKGGSFDMAGAAGAGVAIEC
jgi:hypothetical protein